MVTLAAVAAAARNLRREIFDCARVGEVSTVLMGDGLVLGCGLCLGSEVTELLLHSVALALLIGLSMRLTSLVKVEIVALDVTG
jgi:hypothetical protein